MLIYVFGDEIRNITAEETFTSSTDGDFFFCPRGIFFAFFRHGRNYYCCFLMKNIYKNGFSLSFPQHRRMGEAHVLHHKWSPKPGSDDSKNHHFPPKLCGPLRWKHKGAEEQNFSIWDLSPARVTPRNPSSLGAPLLRNPLVSHWEKQPKSGW